MSQLYVKCFGFTSASREAKSLTTQKGFNSTTTTADYADVVFNVIKDRCPGKCTVSVFEMNEYLDKIADSATTTLGEYLILHSELTLLLHLNGYLMIPPLHPEIETIFLKIIKSTTAQDQRWLVRIILKKLLLGIAERSILGVYHPNAYALYERMTYLSRVCALVESGQAEQVNTDVVALFQPLRCMLCEQVKLDRLPGMLRSHNLYAELKMDGERFQIHKQGTTYRYFSRNNEYTDKFGSQATGKTFSASLDRKLDDSVQSVILDGEMLVWDQEDHRFMAKGENFDARNMTGKDHNRLQVFCVFDILFLNGDNLIGKPYVERFRLLDKLIRVDETVVVICERKRVDTVEEILEFFNRSIDKHEEGIILKGEDSVYKPGVRNNSGWFKLKPDYVSGLINDLDMLVIGARRNRRGFVESFVLGVGIKEVDEGRGDPEENMTFHAVSMVRSGLTFEQWRKLNGTLNRHWQRNENWPAYLDFGNCKPHCWIEPKNSVILQVKATELNQSTSFKTEYTLRFPRIAEIRADKPWFDCCLLSEFQELIGSGGRVQKITKRHAQISDVMTGRGARKSRKVQLEQPPRPLLFDEELVKVDQVCAGLEFCILSTKKGLPNVRELGNLVKRHDGVVVANPGLTTFLCVAGDLIATVNSYTRTQMYDIVKAEWLVKTLGGDEPLEKLPSLKPSNMVATKEQTKKRFELEFDRFNDSFVQEIEDNAELKNICAAMPALQCYEKLLEREVIAFEEEHFEDVEGPKVNLFSGILGFFQGPHSEGIKMVFRSRRGVIVCDYSQATHVFVQQDEGSEIAEEFRGKMLNVKILLVDFITESIRRHKKLEEETYQIL